MDALDRRNPLLARLAEGADPATVVPDEAIIVRGGIAEWPPFGSPFSGAMGMDVKEAAAGVPHGKIRWTTAGEIRSRGGSVKLVPESGPGGRINEFHVDIIEGTAGAFGPLEVSPVPKTGRIPSGRSD